MRQADPNRNNLDQSRTWITSREVAHETSKECWRGVSRRPITKTFWGIIEVQLPRINYPLFSKEPEDTDESVYDIPKYSERTHLFYSLKKKEAVVA
ncbi:hypothetical protein NPIL_17481 [Nephila pilipes]|uniref:Uncharacterized protein n=1 Tax=Nephila pilipes TaxID=299642 RepID=A0A8X6U4S4_NEPPI|nr:hypothetical protein NPIL_17481 [Nephila pilipes]